MQPMKIRIIKRILVSLSAVTLMALCGLFSTHCKRFDVEREIIVSTGEASEITMNTCKATGTLLDLGESGVTQHGFAWSTSPNPETVGDQYILWVKKQTAGGFSDVIEGLTPGTAYYLWAFAGTGGNRIFGDPTTFTTLPPNIPVVETGSISDITPISATCGYNVVSDGGSSVTQRGICWSLNPSPTIENERTNDGSGIGNYTGTMEDLSPVQHYYVRSYAINVVGVGYGAQKEFDTPTDANVPTVHTNPVEEKTATTAQVGGSISDDGGAEIT